VIELDEHCAKILIVLLDIQQAHFNELYRIFLGKRVKFSKPTLSNHLKHLVDAGYVTRTPEKGQLVTYSLNLEKIGESKEIMERAKRIEQSERKNREEFFALTEKKQVDLLLNFLLERKLYEIQALIEYKLDPESFGKWLTVRWWDSPMLEQPKFWIVKKCVEDETYRKKILKIIDEWLKPKPEKSGV
jgi:DNA-binding transcriptional ArsR family regulator